ncbi:gp521 [Bacillus phage G]|uniref:Gp521 n=1 Tax=Bacillus phage G TaxID=2884420 RepID=G3MAR2_9CAUD|nr:gp521 [Bacillus phage G]AEO93779.1 gp521 [Bacillus phage G]
MSSVIFTMMGFLLGALIAFVKGGEKKGRSKQFVCGHCESKDTLRIQKLRDRDVFTCTFCERIIDEATVKMMHKEDYEILKKHPELYEEFKRARLEGRTFEIPSKENH